MKVIITAGGTSESIDNVRKITNISSGRLGSIIAHEFSQHMNNGDKIYYVCPQNAIAISNRFIELIRITDTQSVYDALEKVVPECDLIIHSMAISDYRVDYVTNSEQLSNELEFKAANVIRHTIFGGLSGIDRSDKISSYADDLIIHMVKTPKIIDYIKQWNPAIKLVGFKLLSGVDDNELISVARKQMQRCNCDLVVANDIRNINADKHEALLVTSDKVSKVYSKEEIAMCLRKIYLEGKND